MSGYHDAVGIDPEDLAQARAIRERVYQGYHYRDRVPRKGLSIDGRPALTGTDPADVGRYVVVTVRDPLGAYGDVDHALALAQRFGPARSVGRTGLFQLATADMDGTAVTVVATGSGAPELELALTELMEHSDAEVFVYFGTTAGLHPVVGPGDVVVSSGVVRDDGMTRAYITPAFPAAPSYDVTAAMVQAAHETGANLHVGVTRSSDSDTVGTGRPSVGGYMQPHHAEIIDYYVRAGVLSNDREASAVVTLSTLFGRRSGVVLGVTDNYTVGKVLQPGAGVDAAAQVLVRGLQTLACFDRERAERGLRHWVPRPSSGLSTDDKRI